jgi:polyhydroxyalkanoate synthase
LNFPFPEGWQIPTGVPSETLTKIQQDFMQGWQQLSQDASSGQLAPIKDRRFAAPAWASSPAHLMMAHLYLLSANAMGKMVAASDVTPDVKDRLQFSVMQWVDALSPANFFATNPDAQAALVDSGGESLVAGLKNLLSDAQRGRISQTDETKFQVGENVATTQGAVVFQNRLFQLIQYAPSTSDLVGTTLHQQVLYFRSPARELVCPSCGRARLHGISDVLAQSLGGRQRWYRSRNMG